MKFLYFALAVGLAISSSRADVAFSSFGPDFQVGAGGTRVGDNGLAFQWTAQISGNLSGVTVPLTMWDDPTAITFSVFEDLNGVPGTMLGNWSVQAPSTQSIFTFYTESQVPITSGQQYWLCTSTTADFLGWKWSPETTGFTTFRSPETGLWVQPYTDIQGAMLINVTAIPEPRSTALLVIATLGIAVRARVKGIRRKP